MTKGSLYFLYKGVYDLHGDLSIVESRGSSLTETTFLGTLGSV